MAPNISLLTRFIQLFTYSSQPDTSAVSSLSQLNNVSHVNLLVLKTSSTNIEILLQLSGFFRKLIKLTCNTQIRKSEFEKYFMVQS